MKHKIVIGCIHGSNLYLGMTDEEKLVLYFFLDVRRKFIHFRRYPTLFASEGIYSYVARPLDKREVIAICETLKREAHADIIDNLDEVIDRFLLEALL